ARRLSSEGGIGTRVPDRLRLAPTEPIPCLGCLGFESGGGRMGAAAVEGWTESFQRACDSDAELGAHGKYFSRAYLVAMEEHRVLVKMHGGEVEEAQLDPGPLDERYGFAIRASADTWRRFSEPTPEPMYHGLWATTFRKD